MEREIILEEKLVTGISITKEIIMTTISGIEYSVKNVAKIFSILNHHGVNVNMIIQNILPNGELELSFSSSYSEKYLLDSALDEIRNDFQNTQVRYKDNLGMVSVVGVGMINNSGIAGRFFSALSDAGIDFYQVSTSEISISCSLDRDMISSAVEAAAKEFSL